MAPARDATATDDAIEWRLDARTSPTLRALAALGLGSIVALGLGAVALAALLVGSALLAGDFERALFVLVLALLAVPLTRRYLLGVGAKAEVRDGLRSGVAGVPLPWLAISGLGWLAGFVLAVRVHPIGPLALFVVGLLALVASVSGTRGCVDPAENSLSDGRHEVDLAALDGYRARRIGPVVLCRLSFVPGAVSRSAPRLVMIPAAVFPAVEDAFETAIAGERAESTKPTPPVQRAILLAFGVGLLAVGPLLWLLVPAGRGQLIAVYAGALFGLFGLLFVCYAVVS